MAVTPTPIVASDRYTPPGFFQAVWMPATANKAAPSAAELTAGTNLTPQFNSAGVVGFVLTGTTQDAPDPDTDFVAKVKSRKTAADSGISMYLDSGGTDARSLFTEDLEGFVVFFHEGIATGLPMDVWPVTVTAASVNMDGEAVAKLDVMFAITSKPALNVPCPA